MTREQLDAIRARVEAATLGPWEAVTPKRYAAVRSDAERCYVYTQGKIPADTHPDTVARQQRDAQFIASAREDVPALLAEVERLRAELDTVGEVLAATSLKCDYAFKRGVAAMREAAAAHFEELAWQQRFAGDFFMSPVHEASAQRIRAYPDPEDTE